MPDHEQESRNTTDDALELNKETLRDLDREPVDPEHVKGGGTIGMSNNCTSQEANCAMPGVRTTMDPGMVTVPVIANPKLR